jgi:hypothetical protein
MTYTAKYCDATSIYTRTGLSVSDLDVTTNDSQIIADAESELEFMTGRKWTTGNTKTEYFDGAKKDILGVSGTKSVSLNLTEYPIQSITEFKTLNTDGTTITSFDTLTSIEITAGTYDSSDYWLDTQEDAITNLLIPYGKITLKTNEFPVGIANIKVSYTYGYSTVPQAIKNLAVCLAGVRQWIAFLGGKYNFLNSYSIPQQSVQKGDFYARGNQMINSLTEEASRILDRIGRRPRRLFFAPSGNK